MAAVLVLLTLTVGVYLPMLSAGFVYEDRNDRGALVQDWPGWSVTVERWLAQPLRSATNASLDVNKALFGIQPWGFHLGNVIWHAVNVGLLFAVLGGGAAALWAAAVFAVHPLNVEAVAYVSARSDLVSTAGVLLALWAASAGKVSGAVLGVVLASLGKETAVVAWGLVPLWAAWTWARFPVTAWCGVGAVVAVLMFALTRLPVDLAWQPEALLATWRGVSMVFLPLGFSIEHDWALWSHWHLPALVATVWVLVWAGYAWLYRSWWVFGVVWTLIVVAPRLVVPLYEGLHERHFYVVLVGWCLCAGRQLSMVDARRST